MSNATEEVAQDQLRSFVERIERLEEDKKTVADDIKDVDAEAKGNGFDTKVLRKVISLRKQDANERAEQQAVLELYCDALGMSFQPRLPFGDEGIRTGKPTATVQLCANDGTPLHPPVSIETMKAATELVTRERRKSKPAQTDDEGERSLRAGASSPVTA